MHRSGIDAFLSKCDVATALAPMIRSCTKLALPKITFRVTRGAGTTLRFSARPASSQDAIDAERRMPEAGAPSVTHVIRSSASDFESPTCRARRLSGPAWDGPSARCAVRQGDHFPLSRLVD